MKKGKDIKDNLARCGSFILFIFSMYLGKYISYSLFNNSIVRILMWTFCSFIILIAIIAVVTIAGIIIEELKNKRS